MEPWNSWGEQASGKTSAISWPHTHTHTHTNTHTHTQTHTSNTYININTGRQTMKPSPYDIATNIFSVKRNQFHYPVIIALHRLLSWASSVVIPKFLVVLYMPCIQNIGSCPLCVLPFSSHPYAIFGIRVSFILQKCRNHISYLIQLHPR